MFHIPYGNIFIKQFKKILQKERNLRLSEDDTFKQVIFMEKQGKLLKTEFTFKISQ